jgi:hypothetical protein
MRVHEGNRQYRRAARVYMKRQNSAQPDSWRDVPRSEWPVGFSPNIIKLWRHSKFLVQVHVEQDGILRLSINKTTLNKNGDWNEGITWEELQDIRNAVGFSERDAVEVFPAKNDTVNVANLRHLWIMPEPLAFAWRR